MPEINKSIGNGGVGEICWWCHWGWPEQIHSIYRASVEKLESIGSDKWPLHYGPAHIVWEDENWDSAQWCLDNFEKYRGDHEDDVLAVVRESLERLLLAPDEFKHEPDGYDGVDPEKFPPPDGWVMARH